MSVGGVEFVDPDPEEPEPEKPVPGRAAGIVAVAGWAGAAVLAAVAPFQALAAGAAAHFGIGLEVCAALFVVLGLLALMDVLGAPGGHLRGVRNGAAIGAPCLLAGVTGAIALYVVSSPPDVGFTSYAPLSGQPAAYSSTIHLGFAETPLMQSWCLWLAVAALVCSVVAGIATHRANSPHD
jgi:hypothetical protein